MAAFLFYFFKESVNGIRRSDKIVTNNMRHKAKTEKWKPFRRPLKDLEAVQQLWQRHMENGGVFFVNFDETVSLNWF